MLICHKCPQIRSLSHLLGCEQSCVQVHVALYRLGSTATYRAIGEAFGIGRESVARATREFCMALMTNCWEEYVTVPDEQDALELRAANSSWCGLPNAIGFLDGSHFPIYEPSLSPEEKRAFYNRKGVPVWDD